MYNSRIFQNAKWIIGCKILQSVIQFVIGMLSARFLGPSNYGLINYATSIAAFAIPVMQLGLQSTLVQEYVDSPEKEGRIIGTHLVMNAVAAVACMIGMTAFAAAANPNDPVTVKVCALYSFSLLFQAVDMLQYWFQAKLLSKYSSVAMLCGYLVVSAYKIYLLVARKSVYWFALSHAVEYAAIGMLLLATYWKVGSQQITFSMDLAKDLFSRSRH